MQSAIQVALLSAFFAAASGRGRCIKFRGVIHPSRTRT
jgi:hypothetical protein